MVRYLGHGEWTDGRLFLVMEWLEGEDLGTRIARSNLGLRDSVELVRCAALAMGMVHTHGIIHRDLKPSNIFLSPSEDGLQVKLIDFGLVKRFDPDQEPTQRGTLLGTPWFIAPEQARGQKVDARADVYSLGAVLFRLVTGRQVFETSHLFAYLGSLVLDEAPQARSLRPEISIELDDVLAKTLRRSPAERPSNAFELASLLGALPPMTNEPASVGPVALGPVPAPETRELLWERERAGQANAQDPSTPVPDLPPAARGKRVVADVLIEAAGCDNANDLEETLRGLAGERGRVEVFRAGRAVVGPARFA